MTADITLTVTAQTPWGPFTQVETGKYWRSSKGQIRQDNQHGLSQLIDLRGERSLTHIDYELGLINREVDDQDVKLPRSSGPSARSTGADWMVVAERPANERTPPTRQIMMKTGQDVIEGHKVTIRKGETNGQTHETWTSEDLKLVLRLIIRSPSVVFEQRFHNIRLEEPASALFELPPGFRMHTSFTRPLPPGPPCRLAARVADGISGESPQTYDRVDFLCETGPYIR